SSSRYLSFLLPQSLYTFFLLLSFFFFNDTATTEIYTLSLHDALPICNTPSTFNMIILDHNGIVQTEAMIMPTADSYCIFFKHSVDRKSTRLNSSHVKISYAVFCLKKKKKHKTSSESETIEKATQSL